MNTLKEIINIFVGSYEPITYTSPDGVQTVASGLAGVDFSWLCGAALFLIGIYSIFRILGLIVSKF